MILMIPYLLVGLLFILTFFDSFFFALGGDDWLTLYRYVTVYPSFLSHFDLKNFATNYDVANIMMGLIYRVFEFNPLPYYVVSHLLRIGAGISIFLPIYKITYNKLTGILAAIFFIFAFAGIETTNWVFNMNSYLSIIFFNLFLFIFLSINFAKKQYTKIFLSSLILFLAFIATPTRMHGIIFFVPLLVLFRIGKFNLKSIFLLISVSSLLLFPSVLFRLLVLGGHESGYFTFSAVPPLSDPTHIFTFLSSIGAAILPDEFLKLFIKNASAPTITSIKTFVFYSLPVLVIAVLAVIFLSMTILQKRVYIQRTIIFLLIGLLLFWIALNNGNVGNFGNKITFLQGVTGMSFFIGAFSYFFHLRKSDKTFAWLGILSLFGVILFYLMPWIISPITTLSSDHRYLIIPMMWISIILALLLTKLGTIKNLFVQRISLAVGIVFLFVNILSLQLHLHYLRENGRDAGMVRHYFSTIESAISQGDTNAPVILLFESDNPHLVYHSIGFGFTPHVLLTFDTINKNLETAPFVVDSRASLKDIYQNPDSKELYRYGYKPMKIPLENIYAFFVTPTTIKNSTEEIRAFLQQSD